MSDKSGYCWFEPNCVLTTPTEEHVIDDRHRELGIVLSYLVGRQLSTAELADALGLSRSAYYGARNEGRLISADNLLRAAAAFDLNPIDLLVRYGLVDPEDLTE